MKLDVLIFSAHPDDAELSMGGTIALFSAKGLKVGVIDLTKGEMSTRGNIRIRTMETSAATKILKLKVRSNLNFKDGDLTLTTSKLKKIVGEIRRYKPKIVFAPYKNDRHPDHIDSSNLVKRAVFNSGLKKFNTFIEGKTQSNYRPKKIYYYMQTYLFRPSFIIDISDFFETKMKAVKAFKSQFHDPAFKDEETFISRPEFLDYLEARAKFYGFQIGEKYGEPFYCEEEIELDPINLLK